MSTTTPAISLVLSVHAAADRPLGFDQVAALSGNRVTRAQGGFLGLGELAPVPRLTVNLRGQDPVSLRALIEHAF